MNGKKLSKFPFSENYKKFFEDVPPIKLTEAGKLKLHTAGWSIFTEYHLESVKITRIKSGEVQSTATLTISDRSGKTVCLIKGPTVGLLFGMNQEQWSKVENLCGQRQQLFYRYFKAGLSSNFRFEQRLFYYFCLTSQKIDVYVVIFKRRTNMRNKDKTDAFLEILDIKKCDHSLLDLYISFLRKEISGNDNVIQNES